MQIDGVDVTFLSGWDGKPIKNKLPGGLKDRLKTENQWLESGFLLRDGAIGYEMHSNAISKKLFTYYMDYDVEEITENNVPRNCLTCKIRTGRFCVIAGDYVGANTGCSEWSYD